MTSIALIVTGDLELAALVPSLEPFFPGVEFRVEKVGSVTSTTVRNPPGARAIGRESVAGKLVERLWKAVTVPKEPGGTAADYAVAIDDVELLNLPPHGDPANIVELLRSATQGFLAERFSNAAARDRHQQCLREKCSFHLLSPMVEAYLFGDPAALTRAGVAPARVLRPAGDLEDFRVSDPAYSAPTSPEWQQLRARRVRGQLDPDRHPKDYLAFLRSPERYAYDEVEHGGAALRGLAWGALAASPRELRFARSLLVDLADAVQAAPALGLTDCHPLTWPARRVNRETLTLRNL